MIFRLSILLSNIKSVRCMFEILTIALDILVFVCCGFVELDSKKIVCFRSLDCFSLLLLEWQTLN